MDSRHTVKLIFALTVVPTLIETTALRGQTIPALQPVQHEQGRLELGKAVESVLSGGESDTYLVAVEAGQYMRALVSLPGFETVLRLTGLSGQDKLIELNFQAGPIHSEPLCWTFENSGLYRLTVTASRKASSPGNYGIQLEELREAVPNDQKRISAQALFEEARAITSRNEHKQLIDPLERALALVREVKDRERESTALNSLGNAYLALRQYEKSVSYYEQALAIRREIKNRPGEGSTLHNMGLASRNLRRYDQALGYHEQALVIFREIKDRQFEAFEENNLGFCYSLLNQNQKTIGHHEQALTIFRDLKDRQNEAASLNNIGYAYSRLNQTSKAINYHDQALEVYRSIKNTTGELNTLNGLHRAYFWLAQYETALRYAEMELTIARELKNRAREGSALNDLGNVYSGLREYEKAIGYHEQALVISRETKNSYSEGTELGNIGIAYYYLSQYENAISFFERSVQILKELNSKTNLVTALNGLGGANLRLHRHDAAVGHFQQALALSREAKDRTQEGVSLHCLGETYLDLRQYSKAISYYDEALRIHREVKDRRFEIETLGGLMVAWRNSGNSRLAVFYGKQAVNTVQSIRSEIRGLEEEAQQTFRNRSDKPYHTLAELLISQGRLAEAEQVVGLLKEEEYFQFLRRDGDAASSLNGRADLTAEETEWMKRYSEIGDRLVAIGTERGELVAKTSRTSEEVQRLAALERDLAVGNEAFQTFLGELATHFSAKPSAGARLEQLRETEGIQGDLRELPAGTVAIYALVGDDKYRSILVTPDVQKAYEYSITAADLNRKVFEFRAALQNPKFDPRPKAEELYSILIGGMAKDLRQAKATTLMWSPDGALRYVPIAALFDGKRYLIESYRVAMFTPASNARLKDRPNSEWTAAGFGVTKGYDGNSPLPSVASELTSIIARKRGDGGILEGEIKLDDEFTEDGMRQTLLKRHPVVHIASHFRFQPGDESKSFLLLGDGTHMSLAELKTLPTIFEGVQLLTLSACNTGIGDNSGDGTEVEGFGVLAQRKGAKSVVASLWSVSDFTTSRLMQNFYRIRESSPGMPKVEALRRAQLALLHGPVKAEKGDEPPHENAASSKTPYAHPYYWAPFFLIGNWL